MAHELLLKGGLVVTVDNSLGDLPDADVLIRDGVIVAVASGLSTSSKDAEVIDCKGRLVIPGLVDTHRHVWQGAIGAFTPQMTGAGYGPAVLNGISTRYEPEDIYAGALWGALLPMPTPIFAVCRNRGFAAISFTEDRGRRATCRIRPTLKTHAGCGTSISPKV